MPQSVLITGATGKLGRQFVKGYSMLGYSIAITCRDKSSSEKLIKDSFAQGANRVECIEIDLEMDDSVSVIMEHLQEIQYFPEVLINNARDVRFLKIDKEGLVHRENWQGEYLLDVVVPYELTMALTNIASSKLKTVINIASIYGITAPNLHLYDNPLMESPINYGVTKAALIHLSKELAVRLASKNVSVNSISYGGVEGRVNDSFLQRYRQLCPTDRMLKETEIFGAVEFLSSDLANGMTGHNLVVDGGWTVW